MKTRCSRGTCIALLLLLTLFSGCEKKPSQLQQIIDRGELVVLTRNGATTYYEGPHGPSGLEYDLAAGFARFLGVRLKLRIPDTLSEILSRTRVGNADLAAAGLTVTASRKRTIVFGPAYQHIKSQLVYRVGTRTPKSVNELHGELEIVGNSSHAEHLVELQEKYPELTFQENFDVGSEELLRQVWEQTIDYTVADSNQIAISRRFYPELRVAFDISTPEALAWAFPPGEDSSLRDKAAEYFSQLQESGKLEQLLERYYSHVSEFDYVDTRRYMKHIEQLLPRYRDWFITSGDETGEDWRLIAAVGYQESRWNPKAVSATGVRGIMMLTQNTMKQLDISKSRLDPQASIRGGARYIAQVRKRIPERIAEPDQTWMTLAAYNIGFGHLEDARILTQNNGANPDKWVDVKKHLPLLSQKKWHKKTKHGYARGNEPVRYVESVRGYYDILVWLTREQATNTDNSPALTIEPAAL